MIEFKLKIMYNVKSNKTLCIIFLFFTAFLPKFPNYNFKYCVKVYHMLKLKKGEHLSEDSKFFIPTSDVIFKLIFGTNKNEEITRSFVEFVLQKKIKTLDLDKKLELQQNDQYQKQMVSDIIAEDFDGNRYIIEMQRSNKDNIISRFFGYACSVYLKDFRVGQDYKKLKKTCMIVISENNFPGLKDRNEYHTKIEFLIKNQTQIEFNNLIEMHILELSKYKKQGEKGKQEPWLEFFTIKNEKEMMEMARSKQELRAAVEQLKLLNSDNEVRTIALMEEWHDYMEYMRVQDAKEEAQREGRREGRKEGIIETAKKLIEQGVDKNDVYFILLFCYNAIENTVQKEKNVEAKGEKNKYVRKYIIRNSNIMHIDIILSTNSKINKDKKIKRFKHKIMDIVGNKQFIIYIVCIFM